MKLIQRKKYANQNEIRLDSGRRYYEIYGIGQMQIKIKCKQKKG